MWKTVENRGVAHIASHILFRIPAAAPETVYAREKLLIHVSTPSTTTTVGRILLSDRTSSRGEPTNPESLDP
jgi:hypothetical protein